MTAYELQKQLLHRYDDTRLTTVAMHPRYRNLDTDSIPADLAVATEVNSYNYRYMYFPGDMKRYPEKTFYQSEASTAAMGPNFYEMDRDKVLGLAYWVPSTIWVRVWDGLLRAGIRVFSTCLCNRNRMLIS